MVDHLPLFLVHTSHTFNVSTMLMPNLAFANLWLLNSDKHWRTRTTFDHAKCELNKSVKCYHHQQTLPITSMMKHTLKITYTADPMAWVCADRIYSCTSWYCTEATEKKKRQKGGKKWCTVNNIELQDKHSSRCTKTNIVRSISMVKEKH